jgi:hypothetical protein
MIQRLKQHLDRLPVGTAAHRTDLTEARGLLSECPLYSQAVEQLSSSNVEVSPTYDANIYCDIACTAVTSCSAEHCRFSSTDKSSSIKWQQQSQTSTELAIVAGMYQRHTTSPFIKSRRQQEPPSWMLPAGSAQLLGCAPSPHSPTGLFAQQRINVQRLS